MTPFSSMRSISISYRRQAVSQHRGPWNRSVVGKLVRDRFGSFAPFWPWAAHFRSSPI